MVVESCALVPDGTPTRACNWHQKSENINVELNTIMWVA